MPIWVFSGCRTFSARRAARRPSTVRRPRLKFLVLAGVLLAGGGALAQESVEPEEDLLGRSTPRGAVEGFLQAIDAGDETRAARYLDLRNLPRDISSYTPEQLAVGLAIVLQRGTWIDLETLSADPEGMAEDGQPSYRDLLVTLETATNPVRVLLQRVPGDEPGERIWKFSNATIAELDVLYDEYRYSPYVEWLFETLPDGSFLGIETFKWGALLSVLVVSTPIVLLLAWWLSRLLIARDHPMRDNVRRFLMGPVSVVVVLVLANQTVLHLGMGLEAQRLTRSYTLFTLATVWLLWQSMNLVRDFYSEHLVSRDRGGSIALVRPLTTAVKVLMLLLGLLVWLDNLGYQITAVLAGLGVGGIAVALVLQKPLEDVFGAITLYTQQPVRVGDFGRFGAHTGTVEEISLRTTRIRTLDNTLVAVPNMRLASEPIENLSARQKFLYQPQIRLHIDTSTDQLQQILERVRSVLAEHVTVYEEGARVRFVNIGPVSHDLAVFAYVDAADWAGYLAIAEDLNFALMDVLDSVGAKFALPLSDVVAMGR